MWSQITEDQKQKSQSLRGWCWIQEKRMSCLMYFFLYVCFLNWLTGYLYNSQHFTACGPKSDLPEHTSIVFIVCQVPKQGLSKEQRQLRGWKCTSNPNQAYNQIFWCWKVQIKHNGDFPWANLLLSIENKTNFNMCHEKEHYSNNANLQIQGQDILKFSLCSFLE